jgi:hypothetical protein
LLVMTRPLVSLELEDFKVDLEKIREKGFNGTYYSVKYHIVIAEDPSTPLPILTLIVENGSAYYYHNQFGLILCNIAKRDDSPSVLLDRITDVVSIVKSPLKTAVLVMVAGRGQASASVQIALSKNRKREVRAAAARATSLPLEAMCNLWSDKEPWIAKLLKETLERDDPKQYLAIKKAIRETTEQFNLGFHNLASSETKSRVDQMIVEKAFKNLGMVPPRRVLGAAIAAFVIAAAAGLWVSLTTDWWLLLVGAACILAAWFYTGGPRPYGYRGFGELAVFIFFGLVLSRAGVSGPNRYRQ